MLFAFSVIIGLACILAGLYLLLPGLFLVALGALVLGLFGLRTVALYLWYGVIFDGVADDEDVHEAP